MPLPDLIADNHGPRGAFVVLATIPLLAIAMSATLREPAHDKLPSGHITGQRRFSLPATQVTAPNGGDSRPGAAPRSDNA